MKTNEKNDCMKTVVVASVNGVDILASRAEYELVPVLPVYSALGIEDQVEGLGNRYPIVERIVEHPNGSVSGQSCIPIKHVFKWLSDIRNENAERTEEFEKPLEECCTFIYSYFISSITELNKSVQEELELRRNIHHYGEMIEHYESKIEDAKSQIEQILAKRKELEEQSHFNYNN